MTPAALPKTISVFINRSKELAKADSLISYFCKLYAVERILDSGLHTSDDETAMFAMQLLDDVEGVKQGEDVVLQEVIQDKETSIAYVVNFANKVFGNAKLQIQNQQSTKATAMSLLASVNFFDLLKLWPEELERLELTEELSKKVKYAKYHAARILKAFKSGEDPNEYEPPVEVEEEPIDGDELEVSGENDDDQNEQNESTQTDDLGLPTAPRSIASSKPTEEEDADDVPPAFVNDEPSLGLPSTPSSNPTAEFSLPEPPKAAPVRTITPPQTQTPVEKPPQKEINVKEIMDSSEVYSKAQRHAKFAISAMNYEDKATAVKELELAIAELQMLKH